MPLTQVQAGMMDSTAQYYSFKNRIINGAMSFWQRGTTLTGTSAASAQYIADRWGSGSLTSAYVVSRSTDVPTGNGFQYSLKLQRSAGQTSTAQANVIQAIESVNMLDLAGQSVTLSFWAKAGANFSAASTAMGVIVETGTVADQGVYNSQGAWTGASYPVNTTQTLTTSWQKFTFTGTFGSTALEACVYFYMIGVGTAGADDSIYITGVQLEKGSTATSFDYRPYGTELALCQRYYEKSFDTDTAPANGGATSLTTNAGATSTVAGNNSLYGGPVKYTVAKRATPTLTAYGNSSGYWGYLSSSASSTITWSANAVLFANQGTTGFCVAQNVTNNVYYTIFGHWTSSAEL